MKPYTCTALRIPHMEKIEIEAISFCWEEYTYLDELWEVAFWPLSELRFIEISNKGRINPDFSQ